MRSPTSALGRSGGAAPAAPVQPPEGATPMPATPGAPSSQRVQVAPVEGAAALFTPEFQAYLLRLHDELGARVHALRAKRDERLVQALQHGRLPSAPASSAAGGDWKGPPGAKGLATPGIEVSGAGAITSTFSYAPKPGTAS